jgi:hypothetical protein
MPVAQPSREVHPLCHEHHVEMRHTQIVQRIEGEPIPAPAYACSASDCLVRYASSHGYYLAAEYGLMQRDGTPRHICSDDGQPMYLSEINSEERSFRLWKCPQCDATRTNSDHLAGRVSK